MTTVPLAVSALVALAAIVWAIATYNALVALRNRFRNAFAQIDVQLKRRYDLIPNLVEIAKGYLKHERETLEAVIAARNQALGAAEALAKRPGDPSAARAFDAAETGLVSMMTRLMAVAEKYPDLKADGQMARVSEELTSTENRIAFARQNFNDCVTAYNTKRETFPASLVAGAFGFSEAALLEAIADVSERAAPQVKF